MAEAIKKPFSKKAHAITDRLLEILESHQLDDQCTDTQFRMIGERAAVYLDRGGVLCVTVQAGEKKNQLIIGGYPKNG